MHLSIIYAYYLLHSSYMFGVIISPSSGSWHRHLYKTYCNKRGHNNRTFVVVLVLQKFTRTLIVTYFRAACFKAVLVSISWRWRDIAETCTSYVKDFMHNLWNSALPGVRVVFHFIIMQRINSIREINAQKARIIHHKNTKKKLFVTHQYGSITCKPLTPIKRELLIYSLAATHISTVLSLYLSEQCINTKIEERSY